MLYFGPRGFLPAETSVRYRLANGCCVLSLRSELVNQVKMRTVGDFSDCSRRFEFHSVL